MEDVAGLPQRLEIVRDIEEILSRLVWLPQKLRAISGRKYAREKSQIEVLKFCYMSKSPRDLLRKRFLARSRKFDSVGLSKLHI